MDFDYSESAMNINDSDFDEVWDEIEMIEHCEKIEKSQLFDSEYDDQLYYLCVLAEKTEGQPRRPLIFTSSTSYPIRIANTVKRSIELEDGNKDVKRARVEEPSTSTDTAKSNGKVKMVKARKYVVTKRFDGAPKRSDFDIVEYELPHLEDKEILIKTEWISVDPYLRAYHSSLKVPYDQFSFNIGVVQESKDPKYPVGTKVVTHKGWCDYTIAKENEIVPSSNAPDTVYKVPDLKGLPESLAIGSVGMPGVSAYFGFLEICKPQPGETVVVSGAAGAVGTIVGQIAKIKGCKVIGFAGSDEKVNWLEKELGFDKAINYKTAAIAVALKEAAPEGVDCYYDNVGGDISTLVMSQMNEEGRVTVCGCISVYNEDFNQLPKSNMLQPLILFKELKVQGFLIWKKFHRWNEGFSQLVEWISKGQLKPTEHVTEGFDNLFDAFIGMLTGENKGKAVVKI